MDTPARIRLPIVVRPGRNPVGRADCDGFAAGLVLVREAQGATNDFLANDGLTRGGEVLAATSALFEPLKRLTAFGQA